MMPMMLAAANGNAMPAEYSYGGGGGNPYLYPPPPPPPPPYPGFYPFCNYNNLQQQGPPFATGGNQPMFPHHVLFSNRLFDLDLYTYMLYIQQLFKMNCFDYINLKINYNSIIIKITHFERNIPNINMGIIKLRSSTHRRHSRGRGVFSLLLLEWPLEWSLLRRCRRRV
jgi:hypothetical protein